MLYDLFNINEYRESYLQWIVNVSRQGAVVFQREAGAGGDLIKDLPSGTAIQDGHTGQRTD